MALIVDSSQSSLDGKVALLVDPSYEFGEETARLFMTLGCSVAIASPQEDRFQDLVKWGSQNATPNAKIATFSCDSRDDGSIKTLAETVIHTFKELHILVNFSGPRQADSIELFDISDLDKQFAVNVRAPLLLIQLLAPHLIRTKGCIVNVSSILGHRPFSDVFTYGMAMRTLEHLTTNAASELAKHDVRVNSVIPGEFKTEASQSTETGDQKEACAAIGRVGDVKEIARAILFLATDQASYCTGSSLTVDGGWHVLDREKEA